MDTRVGRYAWACWLGAVLLGCLAGAGCESKEPDVSVSSNTARVPDQQIHDFVLTETKGGRKVWVLKSERAKIFDSSNEIRLDTLMVDFFDESEEHISHLTSLSGVINRTTRDMEAYGEVLIVTDDGLELESDEVRWVNKRGKIISDAPVKFTRGRNVLTGIGFESDPSLENIEIERQVEADVRDSESLGKEESSGI